MTHIVITDRQAEKARNYLQQGYVAYNNWELDKARMLFRKSAVTDPANEEVWLALLNVSQLDEDRKVCLHNILVLNPNNKEAEQRLRLMENDTQPADAQLDVEPELQFLRPDIQDSLWRGIGWVVSAIIILIVGVLMVAILIQPLV